MRRSLLLLGASLLLAACAAPPAPPPAQATPLAQDAAQLTDQLLADWRRTAPWQAAWARLFPSVLMVGPVAEASTGEQTPGLRALRQHLGARVDAAFPEFRRALGADTLPQARWLLHARLQPETSLVGDKRVIDKDPQLVLSLVNLRTGRVVARTSGRVRDALADTAPTAFFADSPAIVQPGPDRIAPVLPGQLVPSEALVELPAQGLIDLAQAAYDTGDFKHALALFKRAQQLPGGRQLSVYNGLYLVQMKLGQPALAQQAFSGLVGLGLESRALALKFLFRPDSTDFWPDPLVSGPYSGWMAQIAQQSAASGVCLDVRGHSSRSGSLDYNLALSLQRAQRIREQLVQMRPPLATRLQTSGLGWTENMVGTGRDDASDAVDRRVEFRVVPCQPG